MGGGLMMDNLLPFDIYEPTATPGRVRNGGYSWPRSPAVDPSLFRGPVYGGRYARPQRNDRSASGVADVRGAVPPRESPVKVNDRSSSPGVRKVRTIPVQDGSREQTSQKATVQETGKDRSASGSTSRRNSPVMDAITAATVIQCVYRGYTVRRTEPLKHLRVISKVRLELKELTRRAAEPAQFDKLRTDELERLKWNEVIMALLLRLDSIQGAHPVVRDMRKSVAKEVVQFQEVVDTAFDSPKNSVEEGGDENHNGDVVQGNSEAIPDEESEEVNHAQRNESGHRSTETIDSRRSGERSEGFQDGESESLNVGGSKAANDISCVDTNALQASVNGGPAEADVDMESPVPLSIASRTESVVDTESTDAHEPIPSNNTVGGFVPQQSEEAPASEDLLTSKKTANLSNGIERMESGADSVVANSELVTSACPDPDDVPLAAKDVSGGDSLSLDNLVMKEYRADEEPPVPVGATMDLERDSGNYQDAKDAHKSSLSGDTEFEGVGKLQAEARNSDGGDTELKAGENVGDVNAEQDIRMAAKQFEEPGCVDMTLAEDEIPASESVASEDISGRKDERARNEDSSGVSEEIADATHDSTSTPVISDLEQHIPNGAMEPEECGSSGRDTDMGLAEGEAPCQFAITEERCNGQNETSGAAQEEVVHEKSEPTSSAPCLWLETPQVSGCHDRIESTPGTLTRVGATELSERETSGAIVSPELSTRREGTGLSDQAMMQKLLEENWKLKAAIGEVLQWGKQQNNIIRNLATRVEQLEVQLSDSNLLKNGCNIGRKRRSKSVGTHPADSLSAPPGKEDESICCNLRRNGQCRKGNERERFYCLNDDCWPSSTESEEFF